MRSERIEPPPRDVWVIALVIAGLVPGGLAMYKAEPESRAEVIAHVAWIPLLETVSAAMLSGVVQHARNIRIARNAKRRANRRKTKRRLKP